MDAPVAQQVPLVDGVVDLVRNEVRRGDVVHHLSATEARLVAYLVERTDRTHARGDLLVEVWGYRPGVRSRTVDTTIQRLRFKLEVDPSNPRHLVTVHGAGYRFEPVDVDPPADGPAFFGRTAEVARLRTWRAAGERVVSLVGPGGMGKTRLALRVAGPAARFCDLTAAVADWDVVRSVGGALRVPLGAHLTLDEATGQIGAALGGLEAAELLLDNAEGILEPLRRLLPRWRAAAPDIRWLVTSREAIGVAGEVVLEVPSLDEDAALALLHARAREVRPDFDLDAHRDDAVALVRVLQAQPLPIELAASRLDLLSPRALLERLKGAIDVLARSGGPERHRTLRGVIEQSWALLEEHEQAGLVGCATFAGRFTASAAEAVLGPGALDVVRSLRRRSLLRAEHAHDEPSFSLYAGVREFAREHLRVSPARARFEDAHRSWFLGLGVAARDALASPDGVRAVDQLELAADDLLLIHDRDAASHPADTARAALALQPLMSTGIPVGRGMELVDSALAAARRSGSGEIEAEVLKMRAILRPQLGLLDAALRDLERARALAHGDPVLLANLDIVEGSIHCRRGRLDEAEGPFLRAVDVARAHDDPVTEARAAHGLGVLRRMQGRLTDAEAAYLDAMRLYRALGDRWYALATLGSLSNVYLDLGRYTDAELTNTEALEHARVFRDRVSESTLLGNRANRLLIEGRLDEAAAAYEEALAVFRSMGATRGVGFALGGLGAIQAVSGRTDDALRTLTRAAQAHRESSNRHNEIGVLSDVARVHHRRGELDRAEAVFREAARLLDEAPAPVLAWRMHAGLAAIAAERGDASAAVALLDQARAQHATVDDVLGPALLGAVEPYLAWADVLAALRDGYRAEADRRRREIADRLGRMDPLHDAPAGSEWPIVALLVERLRELAR